MEVLKQLKKGWERKQQCKQVGSRSYVSVHGGSSDWIRSTEVALRGQSLG